MSHNAENPAIKRQLALRQLQQALAAGNDMAVDRQYLSELKNKLVRLQKQGGQFRFVEMSDKAHALIDPNQTVHLGMESLEAVRIRNATLFS